MIGHDSFSRKPPDHKAPEREPDLLFGKIIKRAREIVVAQKNSGQTADIHTAVSSAVNIFIPSDPHSERLRQQKYRAVKSALEKECAEYKKAKEQAARFKEMEEFYRRPERIAEAQQMIRERGGDPDD